MAFLRNELQHATMCEASRGTILHLEQHGVLNVQGRCKGARAMVEARVTGMGLRAEERCGW
jgi:hypothetical protein